MDDQESDATDEAGPVGSEHTAKSPDDEFAANVLRSYDELFWQPEIQRRGGPEVTGPIRKALAILPPGQPVQVLLNDEAELVASFTATRDIKAGEPVMLEDCADIHDLQPAGVDEDSGWAAVLVLPDGRAMAAFDFRRNRGRGRRLLDLAEQYFATARLAGRHGHHGPALESAHAAAELSVTAMMYLSDDEPIKGKRARHNKRATWLNSFTKHGNAPRALHEALTRLAGIRSAARYGDPALVVTVDDFDNLLSAVGELLAHARSRVGEPLPEVPLGIPQTQTSRDQTAGEHRSR